MKNIVSKILTFLAIGCLSVNAQLSQGITAKVPFNFTAGHQSFTAGRYHIMLTSPSGVVLIKSLDGKKSGLMISMRTQSLQVQNKSTLVFNRYGSEYFLNKVQLQGNTSGLEFYKTARELEVQAKAMREPTTIMASVSHR